MFHAECGIEPLIFDEAGQDDFDFEVIEARSFATNSTNRQFVDTSLKLESAVYPIENTLAKVGIFRVGVASLRYNHVPHKRNFEVFSTGVFQFRGEPIERVDLPIFGHEIMTASMLSSIAFSTDSGTLVCGQSTVNAVVQGVRREYVGDEVVQLVVQTRHYRLVVVYDVDTIYTIPTGKPALYVRENNVLWCVHGQNSPFMCAKDVSWLEPSVESVTGLVDCDSVIFNINCTNYKVTRDRLVVLQGARGKLVDATGRSYCSGAVITPETDVVDGVNYESLVISENSAAALRVVNRDADNVGYVDKMLKSPLIAGVIERMPVLARVPHVVPLKYRVPKKQTFNAYRSVLFSANQVGPLSWSTAVHRPLMSTDAIIDNIISSGVSVLDPEVVATYASDNNIYLVGQTIRLLSSRVPPRFVRMGKVNVTSNPSQNTFAMLVIRHGVRTLIDTVFSAAIRHLGGVDPFFVLFLSLIDDGSNFELLDVVGDVVAPYPTVASIVKLLDSRPMAALELAKILNYPKQAVNMILYGRNDLFICQRGDPVTWKMKV